MLYDSDRAKQVGVHGTVSSGSKVKLETLFKTTDGHYFIHEKDMQNGMNVNMGKITPLPPEEADAWAKKNLGEYPYNAEFGAIKPGGEKQAEGPKLLNIQLPSDLVHKLEQLKKTQGKTIPQIIENALKMSKEEQ